MKEVTGFGAKPKIDNEKLPAVGIDLGTTNSCISIVRDGAKAEVIPIIEIEDGVEKRYQTLPSCVTWLGGDNFVVGKKSYQQRYKEDNTVYSVKRYIGTDKIFHLKYNGEERDFTPEEISAEILKRLMKEARRLYDGVFEACISVPANFEYNQTVATLEAAKIAGIKCLRVVKEPTAAAFASATNYTTDKSLFIYDLGGGTFDVSLVQIKPGIKITKREKEFLSIYGIESEEKETNTLIDVKAQYGDNHLGGDDLDEELAEIILKRVNIKKEMLESESYKKFLLMCEGFKKTPTPCSLCYDFILVDGTEVSYDISYSLTDLREATKRIYNKTKVFMDKILREEKGIQIDEILLVGGSTKNQFIRDFLKADYELEGKEEESGRRDIVYNINPDEAVSLGTAIEAKRQKFGDVGADILDVIALPIGILVDNQVEHLIKKGTKIPSASTHVFRTQDPNGETLVVKVYEGPYFNPVQCSYLGELIIPYINTEKEIKDINVSIKVTLDGLLEVETEITGVTKKLVIERKEKEKSTNKVDKKLETFISGIATISDEGKKAEAEVLLERYKQGEKVDRELGKLLARFSGNRAATKHNIVTRKITSEEFSEETED